RGLGLHPAEIGRALGQRGPRGARGPDVDEGARAAAARAARGRAEPAVGGRAQRARHHRRVEADARDGAGLRQAAPDRREVLLTRQLDDDVAAGDARLAREALLGDEVDVAEVLLLVVVDGREVGLAGDDLHAAQAAGRLRVARGRDRDADAARDREHGFAVV